MGKVEVLISAMNQENNNLFVTTGIQTNALLINQCGSNSESVEDNNGNKWRVICTDARGLSNSRNLALQNANGDFCLLCDDDERLYENYEEAILSAYKMYPEADIICFQVMLEGKKYSRKPSKIGYLKALKVSSVQISMKLSSIKNAGVSFDKNYGSGTKMGSGEENIFLYDCLKKRLNIYYVPICIGRVEKGNSNWFRGFTADYFYKRGAIIRRLMGEIGIVYCLYFVITKYWLYRKTVSFFVALKNILNGYWEKNI